jgi:alkanesulfonate monooxygenase SsuD/methylene tetrahydromethanopterin reductase-like flavin-dependent oxidoreductase (luciferase family)
MRHGFVVPGGDAGLVAELAPLAEEHGWDGLFVAELVWGTDAWIALTAAAMVTSRIRLGTMLTPLSRRRPWDLAGQTATLDRLSGGRVILTVGLGALHPGWTAFERDEGRRVRAEKVDEGLAVLRGLWRGQPFAFSGAHYDVRAVEPGGPPDAPPPVQQPIPVWCVGAWPRPKSMARVVGCEGWLPYHLPAEGPAELTPSVVRDGVAWLAARRGADAPPLDVVVEGVTDPASAADAERLAAWEDAGATWWIEGDWMSGRPVEEYARERLAAGPTGR